MAGRLADRLKKVCLTKTRFSRGYSKFGFYEILMLQFTVNNIEYVSILDSICQFISHTRMELSKVIKSQGYIL